MRRRSIAKALTLAALLGPGAVGGEVRLNGRTFNLADGFELEQVAGPPLVDRPIVADFDEQGRLYVADSSGSNDNVQKQLAEKPHRVVRLEDTDGDGKFDRRTVFADRLMFPEGTLWHDGSLYVAAPPSIWKLTDTDDDGVADRREEWFQGKTLTGCANDLHGPYLGPDGWIYWCKGAFAEQTYPRPGRKPFVTRASHIFRCRPDGTGIEPVMTGGMDNPVDVAFTPGGERIFTTTFLVHPGGGRRDGLIHAVYGGVYGKVHDVIEGHPRTSPDVMPVLAHLGPAAPCGLARYDADAFGPGYRDNLFATLFNLHKVTRHALAPDGATFAATTEDFLASGDLDFHPTDVQVDADGSLVVLDTGGWYKLCCPTSQLVKPDVLGAIYRVRRKGAPRVADPRGRTIDWSHRKDADLAALLDDPRPAVRRRAIATLAGRGERALPAIEAAIRAGRTPEARRNAVWAATRVDGDRARAAARVALGDADETVRQAALHAASVRRDRGALPRLVDALKGPSAQNRRAAAEALGRIGDPSAVPALLAAAGSPSDRVLEHALTYALIEIDDPRGTAAGLDSPHPLARRAAMVALDQMDGGGIAADVVAPGLASPEPAIKEAAAWIVGRHPEWGDALAGFLRKRLDANGLSAAERQEHERQLARFARTAAVRDLLAEKLRSDSAGREARLSALRAMAQAGLPEPPAAWVAGLAGVLEGRDAELARQAVATARALNLKKETGGTLVPALLRIGGDPARAAADRLEALAAVPGGLAEVPAPLFGFLVGQLAAENPVATRALAADVLSRARLGRDQLGTLADALKGAGPLEVGRLLAAFEPATDEGVGLRLVAALRETPARASLRADTLRPRLARFGPRVAKEAEALYALLNVDAARQRARLEELTSSLAAGDVRRGQGVFNSAKASCSACHAIGYLGGHVGPDLTRIGQIRSDRDLLEAIVFPSSSFVRSFEPVVIATREGKSYSGVPRKDAPSEVILATGPNEEVRIPREEIEEIRPGTVSVMPAGLDQQLSRQDLADLVAFLKACR